LNTAQAFPGGVLPPLPGLTYPAQTPGQTAAAGQGAATTTGNGGGN
jgi:hypothetical protein